MAEADIKLVVGADVGLSTDKFKSDLASIVNTLNNSPMKIKVQFDETSLTAMRGQIETMMTKMGGKQGSTVASAEITKIAAEANNATGAVRRMNNELANSGKSAPSKPVEKLNDNLKEYNTMLTAIRTKIGEVTRAQENWTAARNGKSSTEYLKLKEYISELNALEQRLGGLTKAQARFELSRINADFKNTSNVIRDAGENTKSLTDRIGGLANKFTAWFGVSQTIMLAVRAVRQMVTASIELDSAMTQMQIVTKASSQEMENFANSAAKAAKTTASKITDIVDSATTYARLGYNMEESLDLSKFTAMLQNVGDIDVESAQNAITAIIKAFPEAGKNIEDIMNKLVETGNNFPISVSQIAEGMNNASSALAAAGNTFEQSVALMTAANTTIQDAAKSSTGLRTIAARIRNTKTEIDDLGEVMTEANYEELVSALTDAGVRLTDINGEYRSTYDIMADIAAKWNEMSSMEQAAMATALSGTRQQAVFYSMIEQFQEASGAMDAMSDSAGALNDAYDIYLNSAKAHIDKFKASFQEMSSDILNSQLVKYVVDSGTIIINILDRIVKTFGMIPVSVGALGLTKLLAPTFSLIKSGELGRVSGISDFMQALLLANPKLDKFVVSLKQAEGATGKLKVGFAALGNVIKAHPIIAIAAALIAVVKITDKILDATHKSTEELLSERDAIKENISTINSELSEIDEQIKSIKEEELSITDDNDIKALETQIDLLKQRKEILEAKEKNEQTQNVQNAENIIKSAQTNSTYGGASYMLGESGKLSSKKKAWYSLAGTDAPATYSASDFVDLLYNNSLSIHPDELQSVEDSLQEIYETYNAIVSDSTLIGTKPYDIALEKLEQINSIMSKINYNQNVRNDLDKDFTSNLGEGWYTEYHKFFNELLNKSYDVGKITAEDVKEIFGGYSSTLEQQLSDDEKTIEDFVNWINAAAATNVDTSNISSHFKKTADTISKSSDEATAKVKEFNEWLSSLSDEDKEYIYKVYCDTDTALFTLEDWKNKLKEYQREFGSNDLSSFEKNNEVSLSDILGTGNTPQEALDAIIGYQKELQRAKEAGADLNKTVYGNIDTNARQILEWNDENLKKFKSQIMSWQDAGTEWSDVKDELSGSISTIYGGSENFDGVEIAFSPILQTENGAKLLDSDTVHEYIWALIDKATADDGKWTNEELFRLDTEGLEFDGQIVKNLLADIGDTAIDTAQQMHYVGDLGSVNAALDTVSQFVRNESEVFKYIDDNTFKANVSSYIQDVSDLKAAMSDFKSGDLVGETLDEFIDKFPQLADRTDDLDIAITELLGDMNADIIQKFQEQFGKIESEEDVQKLKEFEAQVLELGEVVGSTEFAIDIKTEIDDMDKFFTAMKESVTSTGLTSESISNLKARFQDLENYDPARLFERTENGIHLNTKALRELEHEYENQKKAAYDKELENKTAEYNALSKQIDACTDSEQRASLYQQRQNILDKINDTAMLAAQYEGLTSNFHKWEEAQSIGEEGDMYDNLAGSLENIKKLYDEGLIGTNKFRTAVQLMSNEDLSTASVDELTEAYDKGYKKMTRYFTEGSSGCTNFLKDVQKLNSDWAHMNDDGSWEINFGVGNDQEIADKLGIDVESVQAILRKLSDYGFDINLDSAYTGLELLKTKAETANNKLKELGKTTFTFNVNSTNIDDINEQLKEAERLYNNLKRNQDGSINMDAKGAKETVELFKTLIGQKQLLENPVIMDVDISKIQDTQLRNDIQQVINIISKQNKIELETKLGHKDTADKLKKELDKQISKLKDNQIFVGLDIDENTSYQDVVEKINSWSKEHPEIIVDIISDDSQLSDEAREIKAAIEEAIDGIEINFNFSNDKLNNLFGGSITIGVNADTNEANAKLDETEGKKNKVSEPTSTTVNADTSEANRKIDEATNKKVEFSNPATANLEVNSANALSKIGYAISRLSTYASNWIANLSANSKLGGGNDLNGTAHRNGTANSVGNWGAKRTETALMGEVAPEIWVHKRTGKWELVTNPQFRKVEKGDVIFNGEQTANLLKNGKINSFGDTFINGTAYSRGTGSITGNGSTTTTSSTGSTNGNNNDKSKKTDNTPKVFDWIEVAIDRIERKIKNLGVTAESTFKTLAHRITATNKEIAQLNEEIKTQNKGYTRYMKEANSVSLPKGVSKEKWEEYKEKVRNGKISINSIKNEDLQNALKEYQEWYEKAIECQDAVKELHEQIAELYMDNFNNTKEKYENQIGLIEHLVKSYNNGVDLLEAKGYLASTEYTKALKSAEKDNLSKLQSELSDLQTRYTEAMNSGEIEMYSDSWYEMQDAMNSVKEEIGETEVELAKLDQQMNEIDWAHFDFARERVAQLNQEADFLINLMSNDKLYTDNGQLTNEGLSTMGLHGVNYNVNMAEADKYGAKVAEINKKLAKDPNNTKLIEQKEKYLKAQQDCIIAAEDEKQAIVDMVKEGIDKELESLQKLIDNYKDSLDSAKSLYEYQSKIADKTSEIAKLQKQLTAYSGDSSDEAKAKIQKLTVDLSEAQKDLQETEYDKFISDQEDLLDNLYSEYEEILNSRLDDIDALIEDMITKINDNADTISKTLSDEAGNVGYTLTEEMKDIWDTSKIGDVITTYSHDYSSTLTTVSNTLSNIESAVASMIKSSDEEAKETKDDTTKTTGTNSSGSSSNSNKNKTTTTTTKSSTKSNTPTSKSIKVGGKINAGSAKIYDYKGDKSGETQYFKKDPIYKVLKEQDGWLQVRHHKLSSGITGWFKKKDVKAYKTGGLVDYTGLAQLDGTPSKPELVLNAQDTKNFLELKEILRMLADKSMSFGGSGYTALSGLTDISPSLSSFGQITGNNGTSYGDFNITIPIEKVEDYNDFVTQLQRDPKFERMIASMTVDRMTGGSSLAKYGYRWGKK